MATDRLALAHALEEGGIAREAAERISTEIFDAIHDNVASKTDLRELEQRLDLQLEKLERQIDPMVTRLDALAVVLFGLLVGALHFWPPYA